jgi:hypothetical protein
LLVAELTDLLLAVVELALLPAVEFVLPALLPAQPASTSALGRIHRIEITRPPWLDASVWRRDGIFIWAADKPHKRWLRAPVRAAARAEVQMVPGLLSISQEPGARSN